MQPIIMIFHLVQTMGGALVAGPALRLAFKRPKVHQQRPATQPRLRRRKVPVQRPVGVQQPIQGVHRTVHLVARAMANTKTEEICCRVGESGGNVYLDLANKDRQVIEVTKDGFRIVKNAPLHFLRPSGMEGLPIPTKTKYSLQKLLRSLFRSLQERDLLIIAAFLLGCLRPRGPFPILQFIGAQGSAKSTNSRMIKRCIDPSFADSRSLPKDERDFAIAAQNNWLLCFDNVSSIPKWMSDSFCRLSTGGAVSIRKLYSNSEEFLFSQPSWAA